MFDKFGEFNSCEELNRAAAAQMREGDTEAVYLLAEENGIDREDAEDFLSGLVKELASPLTAAFGKLAVEEKALCPYGIMEDWLEYIRMRCMESEEMALAVRQKGRSLKGCMAALVLWSFKNARPVDKEILSRAGIAYNVTLGIPGMGQAKQIITEYYLHGVDGTDDADNAGGKGKGKNAGGRKQPGGRKVQKKAKTQETGEREGGNGDAGV